MSIKKYCKNEFQVHMFNLEHDSASDFYISCWQRNRATLPLLCINAVIFLGCLAILLTSAIMTGMAISFAYWPIYMTHWGIFINTLASGFALAISCRAYLKGPIGKYIYYLVFCFLRYQFVMKSQFVRYRYVLWF